MRPPLSTRLSGQFSNDWATALLNGLSQVFLLRHPLCGLLCLLAIGWGAPHMLGGVLLGTYSGWLTAKRRHYPIPDFNSGLYGYNGAVLGLLLSAKLAWSPLLPLLIIISSGLSSIGLNHWLRHNRKRTSWPAYTAPFVQLSWLLLAFSGPLQLTASAATERPLYNPLFVDLALAVLRGLSQALLVNGALSCALICLDLWLANRRLALWALIGASLGLLLASLMGQYGDAMQGLYGFNAALTAIVLRHQQRRAGWILSGILLATLLQLSWPHLGLNQPLTTPFILSCWLLQSLRAWRRNKLLAAIFSATRTGANTRLG
jgi:urea transporter